MTPTWVSSLEMAPRPVPLMITSCPGITLWVVLLGVTLPSPLALKAIASPFAGPYFCVKIPKAASITLIFFDAVTPLLFTVRVAGPTGNRGRQNRPYFVRLGVNNDGIVGLSTRANLDGDTAQAGGGWQRKCCLLDIRCSYAFAHDRNKRPLGETAVDDSAGGIEYIRDSDLRRGCSGRDQNSENPGKEDS